MEQNKQIYTRLKCAVNKTQLENRLSYKPSILELQLLPEDMDNLELVRSTIRELKEKGIVVYLHHPMKTKSGKTLDILSLDEEVLDFYIRSTILLDKLCEEENIYFVVHAHYAGTESSIADLSNRENSMKMKKAIENINLLTNGRILWEDTIRGLFSLENPYLMEEIIIPLDLNLCHDLSHSFIAVRGKQEEFLKSVKRLSPYVQYLHVVDSMGEEHDGRVLGEGKIDWQKVIPYIKDKPFVFEMALDDYNDATPMIKSVDYFLENIEKD